MQNINLSQTEREGIKSLLYTGAAENIELARCFLSGQNISEPDFMREEFPEIWILSKRIKDWATLIWIGLGINLLVFIARTKSSFRR